MAPAIDQVQQVVRVHTDPDVRVLGRPVPERPHAAVLELHPVVGVEIRKVEGEDPGLGEGLAQRPLDGVAAVVEPLDQLLQLLLDLFSARQKHLKGEGGEAGRSALYPTGGLAYAVAMRDVLKKYVDAGLGALSSERAEEMARDLLEWSRRSGERLVGVVRREVQRQLKLIGVATRDDLSDLKKRVRALERQQAKRAPAKKASAKKSAAKKTAAKRSSARKRTGA